MHIFKLVVIGHVIHKKGPCTLYSIFCVCECVCLLKAEEIENAMFFVSQFFRKKKTEFSFKMDKQLEYSIYYYWIFGDSYPLAQNWRRTDDGTDEVYLRLTNQQKGPFYAHPDVDIESNLNIYVIYSFSVLECKKINKRKIKFHQSSSFYFILNKKVIFSLFCFQY